MKRLFFMLLAALTLVACDKGGDDSPKPIELTGDTQTTQTIYADETSKAEGIKFKATTDWTAQVSEVTTKADDEKMWFRLSAYEGKAGEITLGFEIDTNDTSKDRKVEIRITCGSTTITITVEQKATIKPEDPNKPQPVSLFITFDGKVNGGKILGDKLPVELRWMISKMEEGNADDMLSHEVVAYVAGKDWSLTLPTPDSKMLGRFHSTAASMAPIIIPVDTKFAGGDVAYAFTPGAIERRVSLELTNISLENLKKGEDYRAKKGEGYVRFVYANQDVVVNEVLKYTGDLQTFNFDNCKLRKGWNELVMVAATDVAADRTVTINVTVNNATSDFKWVAVGYEEPPVVFHGDKVMTINDKVIEYDGPNGVDGVFSSYDGVPYLNKKYSGTEWAYLSADLVGNQSDWYCYFNYNSSGKVESTRFQYTTQNSSELITKYRWDGDKLTAVFDIDYDRGNGMRLDIEYGETEYTKGNVDINWLIANDDGHGNRSFCTPEESAIGVRSIVHNKLISKIVQKDNNGDDKYSATFTYRYEFDEQGYIIAIYKNVKWLIYGEAEEKLHYKFTY